MVVIIVHSMLSIHFGKMNTICYNNDNVINERLSYTWESSYQKQPLRP